MCSSVCLYLSFSLSVCFVSTCECVLIFLHFCAHAHLGYHYVCVVWSCNAFFVRVCLFVVRAFVMCAHVSV